MRNIDELQKLYRNKQRELERADAKDKPFLRLELLGILQELERQLPEAIKTHNDAWVDSVQKFGIERPSEYSVRTEEWRKRSRVFALGAGIVLIGEMGLCAILGQEYFDLPLWLAFLCTVAFSLFFAGVFHQLISLWAKPR